MRCNINTYTVCLGIFAIVYGSFDTYLISMLTTLERRFSLPSKLSGLLQGSSDFGYLLGVLPVSCYGRRAHRPRTLGALGLLLSLGILVMSSPYFIFGPLSEATAAAAAAGGAASIGGLPGDGTLCSFNASSALGTVTASGQLRPLTGQSAAAYVILVLGAFMVGVGSTPFWNLGLAYIDDHVSKVRAPVYISAMMALRFVAPVPGYIVGGQVATIPEDLGSGASGSDGVGAWWLGFVCLSVLIACCSLTMFCFPRRLPRPEDATASGGAVELATSKPSAAADLDEPDNGRAPLRTIADDADAAGAAKAAAVAAAAAPADDDNDRPTPAAELLNSVVSLDPSSLTKVGLGHTIRRLAGNVTFLALLIGAALEFLAFMGFLAFLPKYYQVAFGVSIGTAGLCAGIVEGLSSALGTLGGGIFMSKARLSLKKLLALTAGVCLAIGVLGNLGAVLECKRTPEFITYGSPASCNECQCDSGQFRPVCSGNFTFLSPCLAGCTGITPAAAEQVWTNWTAGEPPMATFNGCGCAHMPETAATTLATDGFCDDGRGSCFAVLAAYNCIFFVLNFLAGAVKSIVCMIVIRSISARDKDIGFGFITFAASFSSTVSPVLYGAIIDAFCLHRDAAAGGGVFAQCLLYHVAGIRVSQHLLRSMLRILCGLAFVVAALSGRKNPHILRNEREIKRQRGSGADARNGNGGAAVAPQDG